jgi:cystathionine beta-synthase
MNKLCRRPAVSPLSKYETFNPGNSTKDRMGLMMIEDAEGIWFKPGAPSLKEPVEQEWACPLPLSKANSFVYLVTNSPKKKWTSCAVGEVQYVCPTDVAPTDPQSYYSTSKAIE